MGVGSLIGSVFSADAARSGANTQAEAARYAGDLQAQAAREATAETRRQYDQSRADIMPWMESGRTALNTLNQAATGDMSAFYASPDYQFRLSEGQRNLGNSFAARGGAASGNALRALSQYNQGVAAGEYGDWWNRTAARANVGQTAANNAATLGANAAANIANINTGAANSIGNFAVGGANARASGLNAQANIWNNQLRNSENNFLSFMGYGFGK